MRVWKENIGLNQEKTNEEDTYDQCCDEENGDHIVRKQKTLEKRLSNLLQELSCDKDIISIGKE